MRHLIWLSLLFIFYNFPCRHAFIPTHHLCRHDQMYALLQFKDILVIDRDATRGCDYAYPKTMSWNNKSGNNSDCCLWDGVICDEETGHVIELDLSCSQLTGTISTNITNGIFHLTHLRRLNLAYNYFFDSHISSEFGRLTNLTHLNLSESSFNGSIPRELSFLSKLVSIDISDNDLTIEANDFDSFLKNLTHLKELFFRNVQISSSIPNSLMNLSSLEIIDLAYTDLHGILPGMIFMLPNLRKLRLEGNNLRGDIPEISATNTSSLEILNIAGNKLFGRRGLPDSVGNLTSLRYLILTQTSLAGELPNSIGSLKSLTWLLLNNCNLTGPIPITIGNLTELTKLGLSSNNFHSQVPITMSNLKKLEILSVTNNRLNGTLPPSLFTIPSLQKVEMSFNQFTGPIPDIHNESSLRFIILKNNSLQGPIPHSVLSLVNLTHLCLASNELNGTVDPLLFSKFEKLHMLDLSHNYLQGSLPLPFSVSLSWFIISHNNFSGNIPSSICNLTSLYMLDVSHNDFGGEIPQCLVNNKHLEVLDLQKNRFSGMIPPIYAYRLRTLNLNDNQFKGPIPESLSNCKYLELLDLGKNKLNGYFPHWLETFSELQVLVLKSNKFQGPVGTSRAKSHYRKLQLFDLSDNEFSGLLPAKYFQDFTAMKNLEETEGGPTYMETGSKGPKESYYQDSTTIVWNGVEVPLEHILTSLVAIDLSANNFEGQIPESLQELVSLRLLNLSYNNLTGPIPASLENLYNLQILDLSSNILTGTIPIQLTSITTLANLNVSYNHLVGQIPRGKQFNTFENNSYIENPGLCGRPLSNFCGDDKKPYTPKVTKQREEDHSIFSSGFTYRIVLFGYGCGVPFGLILGFIMIFVGWPRGLLGIAGPQNGRPRRRRNHT